MRLILTLGFVVFALHLFAQDAFPADTIRLSRNFYDVEMDSLDYAEEHVDILNLPAECVVDIYAMSNGNKVRTLVNYEAGEPLVWDFKNDKGLRVASGVYLVHVTDIDGETIKLLKFWYVGRVDFVRF